MKRIKTYYVIRNIDKYKVGDVVKLPFEEGLEYVKERAFIPFHIAYRNKMTEKMNRNTEYNDTSIKAKRKRKKKRR